MKKIRYILAVSVAALALSTSAFAVGDIVDGVESGAEDIIDGAGDAAGDILGGDNGTGTGDVPADTADSSVTEVSPDESTSADLTSAVETTVIEVTTTSIVGNAGQNNPGTGVAIEFTALGAAAAGLTAMAARRRK